LNKSQLNIALDKLKVGYNGEALHEAFSAQVNSGEFICIIGKNGTGKSTLLRTIAGMQKAVSGQVFLNKTDIAQLSIQKIAKNMALVLTESLQDPYIRVFDLIALGRQVYTDWKHHLSDTDKNIIHKAVRITQTEELLNKAFNKLSDGQKQRVQLARALAQDTGSILLDEPTNHLDIQHKMDTFLLLQKMAHQNQKSIILSTHEISFAMQLADRIWLFDEGAIRDIKPQDKETLQIIGKIFNTESIRFNAKTSTFDFLKK